MLFREAVERYNQRPDKSWGLTDCASFLIMEERGISEALTHDEHFVQAGFAALLRDES
jgi:predicted nucleic acid-binding protein